MRSRIYRTDTVDNAGRRFGSAQAYVAVEVIEADGSRRIGFITDARIDEALKRGEDNPEDVEIAAALFAKADAGALADYAAQQETIADLRDRVHGWQVVALVAAAIGALAGAGLGIMATGGLP